LECHTGVVVVVAAAVVVVVAVALHYCHYILERYKMDRPDHIGLSMAEPASADETAGKPLQITGARLCCILIMFYTNQMHIFI
jgi:hypothetical protein